MIGPRPAITPAIGPVLMIEPPTSFTQCRYRMLHAKENASDQDVKCQIELLRRNVLDWAERAAEARVIEDAVEPSQRPTAVSTAILT